MAGFAEILAQVEAQARAAPCDGAPFSCSAAVVLIGQEPSPPPLRRVAAAYGDQTGASEPVASIDPQTVLALFVQEAFAAQGAPKRLRALRRKMAWLLHPDRAADQPAAAQAMAQINAKIDGELARRSVD